MNFTKQIFLAAAISAVFAAGLYADDAKHDRNASVALWGGYTPYVGAVDQSGYDNACANYTKIGGTCSNKLGGFAGGLDLWMGGLVQLGFAAQYMQAANFDGNSSTSVTTTTAGPLGSSTTTTVKTTEKLNSQFIPIMGQLRIHPKYFYVGVGLGAAINITSYELTVGSSSVSGRKTSNPTGFFAQLTLGISFPFSDEVSADIFVKGSYLTVYDSVSTSSSGTTTYTNVGAYAITPGLAIAFHF